MLATAKRVVASPELTSVLQSLQLAIWPRQCDAGGATIAPATGLAPGTPSFDTLPELPATQVVELLCSRQITAVDYVEALYDRYESGGYECLNPFITYNISQVFDAHELIVLCQHFGLRLCRVKQTTFYADFCHIEAAGADCLCHLGPQGSFTSLIAQLIHTLIVAILQR